MPVVLLRLLLLLLLSPPSSIVDMVVTTIMVMLLLTLSLLCSRQRCRHYDCCCWCCCVVALIAIALDVGDVVDVVVTIDVVIVIDVVVAIDVVVVNIVSKWCKICIDILKREKCARFNSTASNFKLDSAESRSLILKSTLTGFKSGPWRCIRAIRCTLRLSPSGRAMEAWDVSLLTFVSSLGIWIPGSIIKDYDQV